MNDFIQRIGPVERDVDPIYRVERARDEEQERRRREEPRKRPPAPETQTEAQEDVGPVEGEDGHFHIDVRA